MADTALESPLDCGGGGVPQWKRELLQRRAARSLPPPVPRPPPPPPLPPPPQLDEDEELRYGPGIVKRLKSRYLSLALRESPRRRPSILRRAASLEHLLDPPPPTPPPAPPSPAPPPVHPPARRDCMKRARSVDALSREEETPRAAARAPRAPRRPVPLLSEAERPPPDVVRAALRKFETRPARSRPSPAARVPAVLRSMARTPPRSVVASTQTTPSLRARPPPPPRASTPEPDLKPELNCVRTRSPSPVMPVAPISPVVPAALSPPPAPVVAPPVAPPVLIAATNPVLLRQRTSPAPRQVGVIRPMPATREASPVSVVFNFSDRKEVPDYIENDGLVLRSRRDRQETSDGEGDAADCLDSPPSPCRVRFLNDNVLINGRSSLRNNSPADPVRSAKLKLQFDDSLTRTHEYPAECTEHDADTHPAPRPLASYRPSKMSLQDPATTAFQLGVTRAPPPPPPHLPPPPPPDTDHVKPCAEEEGRAWSDTRHTDLLF